MLARRRRSQYSKVICEIESLCHNNLENTMDCSCMSLVIFQFQELRAMAINELDLFPLKKVNRMCLKV